MVDMSQVVTKLAQLTNNGQVPWKSTADPSAFAATFGGVSVLISSRRNPLRDSTYKLAVLDDQGNEIDSASYSTLDVTLGANQQNRGLESIFNVAKRSALGVDRRLEELMNAMDKMAGGRIRVRCIPRPLWLPPALQGGVGAGWASTANGRDAEIRRGVTGRIVGVLSYGWSRGQAIRLP